MDKKSVLFWEEAYQSENITAFSSKPNATIKEFEHLLSKESRNTTMGFIWLCGGIVELIIIWIRRNNDRDSK